MDNQKPIFFNRDVSWLAFNERVLHEAKDTSVPLLERVKFLSIFSSNLDEFYRVRMPVLLALQKLSKKEKNDVSLPEDLLGEVNGQISAQLHSYGQILKDIIQKLAQHKVYWVYQQPIAQSFKDLLRNYFASQVLPFIQKVNLDRHADFFPENNQLYLLVSLNNGANFYIVNIPSVDLPRFYTIEKQGDTFVFFLDDILKANLDLVFGSALVDNAWSFKITRDAELDLADEYSDDLAQALEKQLLKRDLGYATRFLYAPGLSAVALEKIVQVFNLQKATRVEGGPYHNLKDLADFPYKNPALENQPWPKIVHPKLAKNETLHQHIIKSDILLHPPYQSYNAVLRFFAEAASDDNVESIYITLYRVARDSKIVNALISAAKNGKKVTVLVELKARFDEANNIKWAKKMKSVGINIIYSVNDLKVHAKIALVKRRTGYRTQYTGLLATGNFNEQTANFYTDHVLMTANQGLLREMELVFMLLAKKTKPQNIGSLKFAYLLVAQFNLLHVFTALIDREIRHANDGLSASITIKLNNLEEKALINKLYDASKAGVKIQLIIRGICRLVPGVPGLSENITAVRIIDRYLEHGRIFVFHNNGATEVYMGSADWMNRNIYRRIEVCFPIFDRALQQEIMQQLNFLLADNQKAVAITSTLENLPIKNQRKNVQAQQAIYQNLKQNSHDLQQIDLKN